MKVFLLISLFVFAIFGEPITNLPGYNGPKLNMDSGYISVDPIHGRNLFYWLVEAEVNPDTAPLVMWLNGGPGCSSLGGLFLENGPLMIDSNNNVVHRDISYTKVANMLYVESPAGVGFSYSNDKNDYNTNDTRTANDNYRFIQNFMKRFPQYATRDFWIAGESYAGVYIPTLTNLILSNSSSAIYKQFQGFTAGNPVFFCKSADLISDTNVQNEILYWHGLVSYENYDRWNQLGCRTNYNSPQCQALNNLIIQQVGVIDQELMVPNQNQPDLDPDDLYQDFCTGNGTLNFATVAINWPSCQSNFDYLATYLNRADVQQAIHSIRITDWTFCTGKINYTSSYDSMVPLYARFPQQKPGVKILVYSGDIDIMTVPFQFTQRCLNELQRPTTGVWQPWYVNTAHAGYVEYHDTYTFATVKGAGHEVPQYQTYIALHMFQRFITRQNLTDPVPRNYNKSRQRITQSKWLRKVIKQQRQ